MCFNILKIIYMQSSQVYPLSPRAPSSHLEGSHSGNVGPPKGASPGRGHLPCREQEGQWGLSPGQCLHCPGSGDVFPSSKMEPDWQEAGRVGAPGMESEWGPWEEVVLCQERLSWWQRARAFVLI